MADENVAQVTEEVEETVETAEAPKASTAPANQLKTNRALWKCILLGPITLGIYPLVVMVKASKDINTIASKYDGKKTMNFFVVCLLSAITLGILPLVWCTKFFGRIGNEIKRRGIDYKIGKGTFWGWGIFGSLLCCIGPIVCGHKFFKAMNLLSKDYNAKG